MAAAAVRGGCCPLQKWWAGSPGAFSGKRDSDAISRRRRVDHGGGERGQPGIGTGSDPRGAQRGRRGSEAAERRQEAAGGGGGHPAGQAQVGAGVEGSREKEVLPHDPGQGAPQLLGTENEGEAGEEDGPGSGTATGGGEAEGERGKEAAAGGKPEAAPGKRAESRDCPSDPEPPEAQAGQEEAAEAGGKAGYAGPAPEDACEAKQGHGMRRESGSCSFPGTFPRLCQDLQCQTNNRAELGGLLFHRNQLLDPPVPVGSGCGQCRRLEQNFAFPNLPFPHKNE